MLIVIKYSGAFSVKSNLIIGNGAFENIKIMFDKNSTPRLCYLYIICCKSVLVPVVKGGCR